MRSVATRALALTHDAVLSTHGDGTIATWNPAAEALYGYTAGEVIGLPLEILALPGEEALPAGATPPRGSREDREALHRHRCKNGEEIFVALRVARLADAAGGGLLLCASDRGAYRRAELRLAESRAALDRGRKEVRRLAGRLLEAQEEERRRLGRELHDDLSQRLATLVVEARLLGRRLSTAGREGAVAGLAQELQALAEDVRRLSHQLHPAALERLGLAAALEAHAAEIEEREGLRVRLTVRDAGDALPPATALCLYRVAQEALHNTARHSGVAEAQLVLAPGDGEIRLTVTDLGSGFDGADARSGSGLGLVSMEERVHLLGGRLEIESAPGAGTRVEVILPLGEP